MKLTFLGVTGGLAEGFNSNMLIDISYESDYCDTSSICNTDTYKYSPNKHIYTLLLDCGEDFHYAIKNISRDISQIDGVYISHLHYDHMGGLSRLGYYCRYILKGKIDLYIHESLVNDLWRMLAPAMDRDHNSSNLNDLSTYFNLKIISENKLNKFWIKSRCFYLIRNKHINSTMGDVYSYGLFIGHNKEKNIYISTDTMEIPHHRVLACFPEVMSGSHDKVLLERVDIIFHDVNILNSHSVHCDYSDLNNMHKSVKKKTWLYHYNDIGDKMPDTVGDGFLGFVKEGQIFNFEE